MIILPELVEKASFVTARFFGMAIFLKAPSSAQTRSWHMKAHMRIMAIGRFHFLLFIVDLVYHIIT